MVQGEKSIVQQRDAGESKRREEEEEEEEEEVKKREFYQNISTGHVKERGRGFRGQLPGEADSGGTCSTFTMRGGWEENLKAYFDTITP